MKNLDMSMYGQLEDYVGKIILIELKARQLSILHQTFRPIMVATLKEVDHGYVELTKVNIKMQNAPEFIFPTDLSVPINQIAWYMPFDYETRISIY